MPAWTWTRLVFPLRAKGVRSVLYFCQLLGAAKAGWTTFFQPFSTFFVCFKPFSVISRLKSTKNVWKRTKKQFLSMPQSWLTCKSWLTPWGLRGYLQILVLVDILLFLSNFNWFWSFSLIFNKKRWKQLKKGNSSSFCLRAAPKSWSKYTTREVANLTLRKNPYALVYGVKEFVVCLSFHLSVRLLQTLTPIISGLAK